MTNKLLTLSSLKPFVSKSQARQEIVHVSVKEGRATATDSFVLVDVPFLYNGTVPIADGLYVPKTGEKGSEDLKYPTWEKVVPTGEPKAKVYVNGSYLAKVAKLLAGMSALEGVVLEIRGAGEPIVMRAKNAGSESLGLVMPLRG